MKPKTIIFLLLITVLICSSLTPTHARIFDKIIAYVNDDVITKRRLDTLVREYAFELQQVHRYTESEALKEAEKQRAELLDRLIRQKLLLEAALTLKIQVSDAEIENHIQDFRTKFQISSDEEFKKLLNRDGLTIVAYRERIQRDLMAEKLVMGRILPRLQVRDSEIQKFYEENRDQLPTKTDRISLRQIFIAFKPTEKDKKVTADTVNQALEEIRSDKTRFVDVARRITSEDNPDSQAGSLIETTPAEILTYPAAFLNVLAKLKAGEVSDPIETEAGFHVFMIETRTDEKIMFRHLIVPFPFSEEALQAAREQAVQIYKKLDAGEKFDVLAKEHSDDMETREKGGDLGVRILTELDPKTRKVIESLEVGKHSEPFETEIGLYIYKVDERKMPELTQQEKQQIIVILRQQLFEKEWTTYTDSLLENAYIKIKPDAVSTTPTPDSKDN
ncbi:MAG: peptidylprolyl isomerase [Candidatus Poribacteria bacterium]|nr:peptidylprolyl isomerase [Candidatus Poribacteria bacterium]